MIGLATRPLAGLSPIATASVTGVVCALSIWGTRAPLGPKAEPLSGVLFAAPASSETVHPPDAAATALSGLPEVRVSASPLVRTALPPGSRFVADIVAVSTFAITLAEFPHAARKALRKPRKAAASVPAVPAKAAITPPVTAPRPEAPQPATFTEFDEALRASPTTETINVRLKRSGVSFRATHAGRVGNHAVVRFAIANEEGSDFFISIVNVFADGEPIHSETAGPYACRSGQEIFGLVHFTAAEAVSKTIAIELVQSGGERRRFLLNLGYRW